MKEKNSPLIKTRLVFIPFIIIFILSAPFLPFFIALPLNDFRAFIFSRQLADLPLPPSTELVEIRHRVNENGSGNGDYCIFVGIATLESSLTKKELADFYHSPDITFTGTIFTQDWSQKQRFQTWIKPIENTENLFELSVHDGVHRAHFDLRC